MTFPERFKCAHSLLRAQVPILDFRFGPHAAMPTGELADAARWCAALMAAVACSLAGHGKTERRTGGVVTRTTPPVQSVLEPSGPATFLSVGQKPMPARIRNDRVW